jgi:hypothetical protein
MSLAHLSSGSRIWFFIANRPLTVPEEEQLQALMTEFINGWKSHGSELLAGFELYWRALLTMAVDESVEAPSGCSIDKVFRLLQDFSSATGIDFLNRLLLLVPQADGMAQIHNRQTATAAIDRGELDENTPVADVMHTRLGDFVDKPLQPFREHWMCKQLLKQNA